MKYNEIEFDIADLLTAFDELLTTTDEERGVYWFKITRPDGIIVILSFSVYQMSANIIVRCSAHTVCSSINMKRCLSIRVVEHEKRCLEVICGDKASPSTRCLLCLTGDNILEIESQ
jgi:hypothetical protein